MKKKEIVYYERSFHRSFHRVQLDDRGINWLLSDRSLYYMIVITIEYVNRRVKSEFNTIINRNVIAEMYAWFQIRFYR